MNDGSSDFEIRIGPRLGDGYPFLARGPGEDRTAPGYFQMPLDERELDEFLVVLRTACNGTGSLVFTAQGEMGVSLEGIGQQLYEAIFTPRVKAMYQRNLGRAAGNLRIKLSMPQPELARLPWEYLHDGQRFLGLDLSTPIVRGVITRPWPPAWEGALRLLIAGASPEDQVALDLASEYQIIDEELAKMEARGDVLVRRVGGHDLARDLPQIMWEFQPHVLHFAGHGTLDSMILEDGAGRSRPITGTSLRDLLGNIRSLKLVVLNACEMAGIDQRRKRLSVAARLVQVGIPMAVGMQFQISDSGALAFSEGFYEALAQGMSLEAATAWARVRISYYLSRSDGDTMEWGTPIIHVPAAPWQVDWREVAKSALARGLRQGSLPQLPQAIVGLDGKEMRLVPAGAFAMGSEYGPEDERPQHRVDLPAFWIDAQAVTNAEYARFVEQTGHKAPPHWLSGPHPPEIADHPVTNVSWHDAQAYAAWVGERLPTEAEWEKAARGTDGRIWPWGNAFHPSRCNSRESGLGSTAPVDGCSPAGDSPYGASGMAGNVWEWTSDRYGPYPGASYRCSSYAEDNRVLRGGSWSYSREFCRCSTRTFDFPDFLFDSYGFRCVADETTLATNDGQRQRADNKPTSQD